MAFAAQAIPIDEPYLADSRELIDVPASLPGVCTMGGVARADGQGLENVALRPGVTPRASSSLHVAPHRIENLNDGANGNPHSWILGEKTGWVQLASGRRRVPHRHPACRRGARSRRDEDDAPRLCGDRHDPHAGALL